MNGDPRARVGIVGFGHVGKSLAALLTSRGHSVVVVDQDASATSPHADASSEPGVLQRLSAARRHGLLDVGGPRDLATVSVAMICVGTPASDHGDADLSQVRQAIDHLAVHLPLGALVILKSTVPPGTTVEFVVPRFELHGRRVDDVDLTLAHCPERFAEGSALRDLEDNPVIVGGHSTTAVTRAVDFWSAVGLRTHVVNSPTTAELVKLADNVWIDVNVALATELARLCDGMGGIDVLEVIAAANTLKKGTHHVNLLTPSIGVGGACLTKDPLFLVTAGRATGAEQRLAEVARAVNDNQPAYSAARLLGGLRAAGRTPSEARIAVLGLSYKSGTGDIRESPAVRFLELLRDAGADVRCFDPLVAPEDAAAAVGTMEPSFDQTVTDAHAIAVLAAHAWPRTDGLERAASAASHGCLLFDGRLFLSADAIQQAKALGLVYLGVGR